MTESGVTWEQLYTVSARKLLSQFILNLSAFIIVKLDAQLLSLSRNFTYS